MSLIQVRLASSASESTGAVIRTVVGGGQKHNPWHIDFYKTELGRGVAFQPPHFQHKVSFATSPFPAIPGEGELPASPERDASPWGWYSEPYNAHFLERELIRQTLMDEAQKFFEQTDWSILQAKERRTAELRAQSESKRTERVEATMGLGEHIDWGDLRIQRYTTRVSIC